MEKKKMCSAQLAMYEKPDVQDIADVYKVISSIAINRGEFQDSGWGNEAPGATNLTRTFIFNDTAKEITAPKECSDDSGVRISRKLSMCAIHRRHKSKSESKIHAHWVKDPVKHVLIDDAYIYDSAYNKYATVLMESYRFMWEYNEVLNSTFSLSTYCIDKNTNTRVDDGFVQTDLSIGDRGVADMLRAELELKSVSKADLERVQADFLAHLNGAAARSD